MRKREGIGHGWGEEVKRVGWGERKLRKMGCRMDVEVRRRQ